MIFLVTDIDEPKGICSDSPWVAKLSVHSALTAKGTDKVSSCVKDLDSVVVSVGNDILSNFVNCHAGQAVEFTLSISVATKTESVLAVFVKNLYAMVRRIGNDYREKKQKFSLIHELANRWLTISKTGFCLHFLACSWLLILKNATTSADSLACAI